MVNISKLGDSTIKFTFTDNDRYLYNGEITLPLNSLILEFDTSDLVIFKKIDGDVFVTFLLENSNFNSKAELESWYKANMVGSTGGGGGVTSGEVQTMIDEAVSGKVDSSAVTEEISAAVSGKTNQSDFTAYTASTDAALSGKANSSDVTEEISAAVSGKVNVSDNVVDAYSYYIKTDDYSNPDYTYDSGSITIIPEYCHKLRIKLNGSLGNSQLFNRLRVGIEDADSRTNIKSYLTVTSNEDGKFSSASLSSDAYCTATVDSDGILWLEGKNGYGFTDFRVNTSNTIEVVPFPYYDVESGQTADVLNDSVVKNINVLKNVANGLATRVETPYENGLSKSSSINVTTSGLTFDKKDFKNNTTYNVIPLDESLGYNNSLGVYATGATHSNLMNANTATNGWLTVPTLFKPLYQVTLALNQSFTGTVSTSQAIRAYYYEGSTQRTINWDYDSVNDSFTNTTSYTSITLTYDNVAKVVTLTLDSSYPTIEMFGTNWSNYIAPINDLTNADCWIGAVTVNTNLYKLQEALDNKQDTLIASRGISITTGETADTVSFNLPISAGTGTDSIVEGNQTSATTPYSHAEGDQTLSSSWASHAEGTSTIASGDSSHAEGFITNASGGHSHAEGDQTIASGSASHAEGDTTVASGDYSHAEGSSTSATGIFSHAEGYYTIANNRSEHAGGQYNLSNKANYVFGNSGNTLFSVGNGTADDARHNAFEIRQNGDIYIVKDGSDVKLQDVIPTTTSAVTSGSTDVITSGGVYAKMGGMTIVKITESEYQSLSVKDPDTLYVVIPDPTNP